MSLVEGKFRPLAGADRQVTVSSEQLHAHACIVCGLAPGQLQAAGHVFTAARDGEIGWAVVACPNHVAGAAA